MPSSSKEYFERLDAIAYQLDMLIEAVTEPYTGPKMKAAKRRSAVVLSNPDTAKRARIGRAAARLGMSYKDYVAKYGMLEKKELRGRRRKTRASKV